MSEERQDKEIKKVTERIIAVKRGEVFKNVVTADKIRKEANFLENLSQRSWPRKYEYLTGRFFNEVLVEECREAGLPLDTFERNTPEDAIECSPIPLKASPAIPRTTSATIGHRSSHSLEFVGRLYVSPKWNIEPHTNMPTQQKFIFLG